MGELLSYFKSGNRIYPDDTDLNTITNYGIYSGANAKTATNSPSDAPANLFMLIVYGYDGPRRVIQALFSVGGYLRTRAYTSSPDGDTWSDWK